MENKDPVVMHPLNDFIPGRGGGYFKNFRVGMCRWDPGTLSHRVNSPNVEAELPKFKVANLIFLCF